MNILVCIKRVPLTGARIVLTDDKQGIDTRNLGFTISPHEECAVEEAVQWIERYGGSATVLTLGSEAATEQLRSAMAVGVDSAILLETGGEEWDAVATAKAIVEAILMRREEGVDFDALFFGNESADAGGYQVGIRVAHALGLPCVTGVKALSGTAEAVVAKRQAAGHWESFEVALPAVFTIKEGLNLPRYPSLPGRLRAKKKPITQITPAHNPSGMRTIRLAIPPEQSHEVQILGEGPAAAGAIVDILKGMGGIAS